MRYLSKIRYLSVIMLPFACAAASAQPVTVSRQTLPLQEYCALVGLPPSSCAQNQFFGAKAGCLGGKRIVSVSCGLTNFTSVKGLFVNSDGLCVWGMTATPDPTARAIISLGCQR